jgi:hypothetical protein
MKIKRALCLISIALTTSAHAGSHVFMVVEENHSYNQVIGNKAMPYLNSLAQSYGLATHYFAVTHPSIGNYFSLTTGQIITNNDHYTATVYADNIVRHLLNGGKTWKEYSEDLPSVGYSGGNYKYYTQHHNPLSYFTDVRDNIVQRQNLVPFTHLSKDITAAALPNFGLIIPNDLHNGHDRNLAVADDWLKTNIAPLVAELNRDDLLIITFDESSDDSKDDGGRVAWVLVGPSVKKAFRSDRSHTHPDTLRFVSEQLGIGMPKPARHANSMTEFLSR